MFCKMFYNFKRFSFPSEGLYIHMNYFIDATHSMPNLQNLAIMVLPSIIQMHSYHPVTIIVSEILSISCSNHLSESLPAWWMTWTSTQIWVSSLT
jgi:hypothetical protein